MHPRCRLLRRLLGARAAAGHSLVAVLLLACKRQLRLRRLPLRLRGVDQRALAGEVSLGVVLPGASRLLLRRRLRQGNVEFTRVDHRQQFPCLTHWLSPTNTCAISPAICGEIREISARI